MITIEWAIEELQRDPAYQAGLLTVAPEIRASIEAETIAILRQMLEPMLPLINALHTSEEAREHVKRELIASFGQSNS